MAKKHYVCSRMRARQQGREPMFLDPIDAMREVAGFPPPKQARIECELIELKPYDFPTSLIFFLDNK